MPRDEPPRNRPRETGPVGQVVRFGSYLLHKRIAVGGMSEVYLAKPIEGASPAPILVIKRLLPTALEDPASRKTFETEARLNMAARHANVVEVFEAGEFGGEPYLAMEYVSGADAYRLMRRCQSEVRAIPPAVAIYIARELCKALACVHNLSDDTGHALGIVHRDVTPSNIYLSENGDVKLGDFGIARAIAQGRASGSHALKGKYGYLAPEQVSGEPADHRADLFSLAVVLAEMLIGKSLFPGAGQLAVLLAIRDCRIDPLRAAAKSLPSGLLPVLERALAKSPEQRFASAEQLCAALLPFEQPEREALRVKLADLVVWARDQSVLAKRLEGQLRASSKSEPSFRSPGGDRSVDNMVSPAPQTSRANIRTHEGNVFPDVPFSRLVELIVTGELTGRDEVDMDGSGFRQVQSIDVLARHLPQGTATTTRMDGPGIPDYAAELQTTSMLEVMGWLLQRRETGALFAERPYIAPPESGRPVSDSKPPSSIRAGPQTTIRKELYLDKARLVLVASTEPSELLGEYLVRHGAIDRAELDMALVALPRYDGRLGDTLIGLGLVDPVEVFRAIQNQGRARVADIFRWSTGRVTFYRGVAPQRIDFRLDLDLPELMLAGLEHADVANSLIERYRKDPDTMFAPIRPPPSYAMAINWPPAILTVIGALGTGRKLGETLAILQTGRNVANAEAIRALEVAIASGIVQKRAAPAGS
jgi:eukaryotic-like serine/threonine-protein kinase